MNLREYRVRFWSMKHNVVVQGGWASKLMAIYVNTTVEVAVGVRQLHDQRDWYEFGVVG